jgi:hypothetical protein
MVWMNQNKRILFRKKGQYSTCTGTHFTYQKGRTKKEVKKYGAHNTKIPTLNNSYFKEMTSRRGWYSVYLKTDMALPHSKCRRMKKHINNEERKKNYLQYHHINLNTS